mgnify:CR=1 FL=1
MLRETLVFTQLMIRETLVTRNWELSLADKRGAENQI